MRTDDFLSLHKREDNCSCIYFLKNKGDIVYIGSTNNPHARVYSHTRSKKVFDDVSIMTCSKKEKLKLEGGLIRKHLPLYNNLVPKNEEPDNPKKAAVAVRHDINKLLDELVISRVDNGSLISNKVSVVADLIIKAHKKECK